MRVVVCDTHLEKNATISVDAQHSIYDIKFALWNDHDWAHPSVLRLKLNEESGDLCNYHTLSDYNIRSDCILLCKTNWELSAIKAGTDPTGDWDRWHKKVRMLLKDQEEKGFGQMEYNRRYELLEQEEEAEKDKMKQLLHQFKGIVPYQGVANWMERTTTSASTSASSSSSKRRRLSRNTSCTTTEFEETDTEDKKVKDCTIPKVIVIEDYHECLTVRV